MLRCIGLCVRAATAALFVWVAITAHGQEQICCKFESNREPVWGKNIPAPYPQSINSCKWERGRTGHLAFASADRVVVALEFRCFAPDGLVKHTEDRLVELDAKSGNIVKAVQWRDIALADPAAEDQVFAVDNNRILFRAGGALKLCSIDLEELRSRALPVEWFGITGIYPSPSGRIGSMNYPVRRDNPRHEQRWFSTETLQDLQVEMGPRYLSSRPASDDQVVYQPPENQHGNVPVYLRKRGEEEGRPLCDSCFGVIQGVTPNGLVFLSKMPPGASFLLVDRAGTIVYKGTYGRRGDFISWYSDPLTFSRTGHRLVFQYGYIGGLLNPGGHFKVVVFDTASMKNIFQVKITEHPQIRKFRTLGLVEVSWRNSNLALSPDGSVLAILYGTTLKLFRVTG